MKAPAQLPPAVRRGDRVGVAALSGAVNPERLAAGLDALRQLGYEPVEADNLRSKHDLFAGSDEERLTAFHRLAADPSLKAILFARGGYGVHRILPGLDWPLLARHPRAYVGYSDLTPFLLQVVERLGLVAFHGPMVAGDFARGLKPVERRSFKRALRGRFPRKLPVVGAKGDEVVEGPLLGGCLSMLVSLLGTPFDTDLDGAILFLEDVNEVPYRFDRMLTHYRLSGNLANLRGLIAGHLTGDDGEENRSGRLKEMLQNRLHDLADSLDLPWAWGLHAGHASPNLTLPMGLWARLDPRQRVLILGSP